MSTHYDAQYYRDNGQDTDRPALGLYTRLVDRYGAGGPYLDFGCGTGHLLKRLAALGPAEGFEISEYSAATARTTSGRPVATAMEDLADASIGTLTAIHVLEHLDDATAAAVLATWRRVLVPGGRALVVMPDPAGRARALAGEGWNGFADPTHINLKPHAQWRAFLTGHGFTAVVEGSDGLWNVPYSRLPRLVDAARHAVPALVQFLLGRLFLRPGSGESSVFVLRKD